MTEVDPEKAKKRDASRAEEEWKAITFAIALGGISILGFVVWRYVFHLPGDTAETLVRSRIVAPFGVLYVAAVTFSATIWRTLITARQADAQQAQLENVARQIQQTDENNLAGLLQKGAELLADTQKRAHISAGIATLKAVAIADNDRFAVPAMDLLADFVSANSGRGHSQPIVKAAIRALAEVFDATERTAGRGVVCSYKGSVARPADSSTWIAIRGVYSVDYIKGIFSARHYVPANLNQRRAFRQVYFNGCSEMEIDHRFLGCTFQNCQIRSATCFNAELNTFSNCNFSGTVFIGDRLPRISNAGTFDPDNPPILENSNWEEVPVDDWSFLLTT